MTINYQSSGRAAGRHLDPVTEWVTRWERPSSGDIWTPTTCTEIQRRPRGCSRN